MFCNYQHKRITAGGVRYILKKLEEKAGVENIHPHRFRRTFATKLAARGMDIQEIQKLLGHTNINTTMQYVHINNDKIKASYNLFIG